jgi:hypothetical protein
MFALPPAFLSAPAGGGGGDPSYNSVKLLLHMNGANNGTTFTDNSPIARTVTAVGNAKTSTAQSVFNGSSGLFDGTGDYLNCGLSADYDFGSGDFTIEGAIRPASVAAVQILMTNRANGGADTGFFFYLAAGGQLNFAAWNPAGTVAVSLAGATFSAGSWQWFAVRRSGSAFTLWKDAVNTGSATYSGAISASFNVFSTFFGTDPSTGGRDINGHAAEVRVTKGVARTIVVPTSPWPDSL